MKDYSAYSVGISTDPSDWGDGFDAKSAQLAANRLEDELVKVYPGVLVDNDPTQFSGPDLKVLDQMAMVAARLILMIQNEHLETLTKAIMQEILERPEPVPAGSDWKWKEVTA